MSPDTSIASDMISALSVRDDAERGALHKLMTLRWVALSILGITIWTAGYLIAEEFALLELNLCLGVIGASNLCLKYLSRGSERSRRLIGASLLIDIFALSVILSYSGGPANPFSVLYLILVMLTAIMTNAAWTWSAVVTSSLCYALIFWCHTSLPSALGGEHEMHSQHGAHSASFSLHLQGMWLAYTIAAIAIALFVSRLSVALQRERERRLEGEKLLGLAALAAGAAHEIGNPLGTIRVVTSDLESLVKSEGRDSESVNAELLSDIKLINDEVERAKRVLDRLASSAGELRGEPILPMNASRFFKQLHEREEVDERVSLNLSTKLSSLTWPTEAVSQALIQLLRNACQASPADASVILSAHAHQDKIVIEIIDQGHGMSDATLARYGTPFFTTREGSGIGLGVFVAKSLVERLRGDLTVRSAVNEGTTVSVTLPLKMTDSISPQE